MRRQSPVRRPVGIGGVDIRGQALLEAVELVGTDEVHLAGEPRVVATVAEVMRHGRQRRAHVGRVVEDPGARRQPPREQARARRSAQRRRAIGALEHGRPVGQRRQLRCVHEPVTVSGQARRAELVGHDQEQVRRPRGHSAATYLTCTAYRVCDISRVLRGGRAMVERDPSGAWLQAAITRREVIRGGVAGGLALSASGVFAACGGGDNGDGAEDAGQEAPAELRQGGTLRIGATGGGAEDTVDAHKPTSDPDIMRVWQLYEPLAVRPADFSDLEMVLAESLEADAGKADQWTVRLKEGLEFHNGKPVTADDVIFSLQRILDPKDPKVGAASIGYVDAKGLKKIDDRTVEIPLQFANSTFPEDIGQYFNGIVPADYDPKNPVGTGAFKYKSLDPGEQSTFVKHANYWRENEPYVDELIIIDFTEPTAKVNALLGGQVQAINNVPFSQLSTIQGNSKFRAVISETGSWQPITMRVDAAPFDDNRVRQAFRLMADREQMVQQVLSGQGRIANDLYAPYDDCYADDLPQREQDLDKVKSLLKQAGQSDLRVELVTGDIFRGVVEAAQVFAEQAKGAGVQVKVRKVDTGTFYGDNYLKWPFAQDFWSTRTYLTQVAQGSLPDSPFNETHWNNDEFNKLIREARGELDDDKRCELLHQAQELEYNEGGHIIPYFSNAIDAHSAEVGGIVPARSGFTLGNYRLRAVGYKA